ncbi:hypothetical protein [Pseudanabaena sp. Chao 1811]|uniref:hypothetical protein n=1 Tax=Pseudanabaena sp. Chao 1811 TaxID=2963092 RepID=UPI0022F38E3C|nr:hypothetical protein [Pseudanabaena sp. Chao 1811]
MILRLELLALMRSLEILEIFKITANGDILTKAIAFRSLDRFSLPKAISSEMPQMKITALLSFYLNLQM